MQTLESVRQLYQVFTTKQLLLEWLLEINVFIGRKLTKSLAVQEVEQEVNKFTRHNNKVDMRTMPNKVKKNIIHDEGVLKMRWDLCSSCEFLKDNKCQKCGCFMKVKHKMAIAKCPIGKWDKYVA